MAKNENSLTLKVATTPPSKPNHANRNFLLQLPILPEEEGTFTLQMDFPGITARISPKGGKASGLKIMMMMGKNFGKYFASLAGPGRIGFHVHCGNYLRFIIQRFSDA